tara:strand:- start:14220 stop:15119 length:900 start_codon:yes stop_codon:yes gene_type:complete
MNIQKCGYKNFKLHTLQWFMIDVCNMKCSYCIEGFGNSDFLKTCDFKSNKIKQESYKKVLKILNIKRVPKFNIELLGGEPTLHPQFNYILESLTSIEQCIGIEIMTNLKNGERIFENVIPNDKVLINPSIHFESYDKDSIQRNIKDLIGRGFRLTPTIMLHDKSAYWDKMLEFFNFCINNNIKYNVSYLYKTGFGYDSKYTEEFNTIFKDFIKGDERTWPFQVDDVKGNYSYDEIINNKMANLKNINCKPLRWIIDYKGGIYNACSKLPFILHMNKETTIKCPFNTCGCDIQWDYEKHF